MAPATEKTALADGRSSKRPCHGDAEVAENGAGYSKIDAEIRRGRRRAILPVIIIAAAVTFASIAYKHEYPNGAAPEIDDLEATKAEPLDAGAADDDAGAADGGGGGALAVAAATDAFAAWTSEEMTIVADNHYTRKYGAVRSKSEYPSMKGADLVEPYVNTTLTVAGVPSNQDWEYQWQIVSPAGVTFDLGYTDACDFMFTTVTTDETDSWKVYLYAYARTGADLKMQAQTSKRLVCKYVRRELRTLFEEDRKEVLSALKQIHSLSSEAGTTKFGTPFYNYVTLTAMHNSNTYCYHDGLQFLTSHPMFSLMVEKTMQNINPKLTLPYWDFLVEGKEYGADFYKSFVYGNDYFGSVDNGAADSYTMRSGSYFTGIPHAWDADGDISGTNHNAHGGVFDGYNENANQTLKRSNEFCGLANTQTWPVPDDLFNCMVNASWLYGWDECMENNIHANFHGWHGGAWDCAVDFSTEYLDDKWDGQLDKGQLGFLGPMARAAWYQYAPSNNWTHCPRTFACNSATHTGGCKCSSKLDVDKMTDEEVDGWAQPFIDEVLNGQYQYDKWLEADSKGVWWWKNMDTERSYLFNRLMLKWGSSPGFAGAMGGGPASNDPIFWVIHPLFEKAAHAWLLSDALSGGKYKGWTDSGACPGTGSSHNDTMPFPDLFTGTDVKFNNRQLWEKLDPSTSDMLPYIYDQFDTWGGETFNPFIGPP